MTTLWVLIFLVYSLASQISSVGSAEFTSEKACIAAKETARNSFHKEFRGICVPKG